MNINFKPFMGIGLALIFSMPISLAHAHEQCHGAALMCETAVDSGQCNSSYEISNGKYYNCKTTHGFPPKSSPMGPGCDPSLKNQPDICTTSPQCCGNYCTKGSPCHP